MSDQIQLRVAGPASCPRCHTLVGPGEVHWCGSVGMRMSDRPVSDPATLRAIAERWDSPTETPTALVGLAGIRPGVVTVGYLMRRIADAMDEALASPVPRDGEKP